ncbi:MAG: VWA domain-containing protein, partial [Spirochaetia bacterium]|nr:VWA domain-containing protein [Spirochaetia bacterium]
AEILHTVILIDATRSLSKKNFKKIKEHAEYFVSRLNKKDSAAIYKINGKPELVSEFESDEKKLTNSIASINREGNITRIHDSLYSAMSTARSVAENYESGFDDIAVKTAVVVFTDGRDEGSFLTNDDVAELSKFGTKHKIPVYSFLYGKSKNRNDYNRLSKKTGGMLIEIPGKKNIRKVVNDLRQLDEIKFRLSYGSLVGEKRLIFPGTKITLKIKWSSGKASDQITSHYKVPWSGFIKSMFSTAFAVGLLLTGILIFAAAAFFFWRKKTAEQAGKKIDTIYGKKMPPPPNLKHPLHREYEESPEETRPKREEVFDLTDILNGRSEKIFSTGTEDLQENPDEEAEEENGESDIEKVISQKNTPSQQSERDAGESEDDRAAIVYETAVETEKLKKDPSNLLRDQMDEKKAILLKRHAYGLLQTALRHARPYKNASLIHTDERQEKEYDLFMDSTVLGSGRWAHIHLNDRSASPIHARIKRVDHKYIIYDMMSESGTFLNGKKLLRPKPLSNSDVIKLGNSEFIFQALPVED